MTVAQFWTTAASEIKITSGGGGAGGRDKDKINKGRGSGGRGGWTGRGGGWGKGGSGGNGVVYDEYIHFLIKVTDNNGDTVVGIDEIWINDADDNNLARGDLLGPGTPLGNSKVSYVDGYDGVYKNYGMNLAGDTDGWIDAETGQTGWTQIFFDSAHDMTSCVLTMADANRSFKDFKFQYSDDGSAWTTVHTVTGAGNAGFFFDSDVTYSWTSGGSHRYWRIDITATVGGNTGVQAYNIRWLNSAGLYVGPTRRIVHCTANTNFSDNNRAFKMFDGPATPVPDTTTGWLSTSPSTTQFIRIGFPFLVRAKSMTFFVPRQSGVWRKTRMPKDFTINARALASDDWTIIHTAVGETDWQDGESREFMFS